LKVFSVGNSFSGDSITLLSTVANACGYSHFVFAFVHVRGSSLEDHYNNLLGEKPAYKYIEYDETGLREVTEDVSLFYGIERHNWDIITFQQGSGYSGKPESITPFIKKLANMVKSRAKREDLRYFWHSTWAYPKDGVLTAYDNSQEVMYDAIINVAKTVTMPSGLYDKIIPTGTAVQNMRGTLVGDNMNRDALHLERSYARLTASLTWLKTLYPDANLNLILEDQACLQILEKGTQVLAEKGIMLSAVQLGRLSIDCANAAIKQPYEITKI